MQTFKRMNLHKPAVFLDRDGVLTVEQGYVDAVEKLCIFPYAAECVRRIHDKGFHVIVVTNQSGVARGLFTEVKLKEMNDHLKQQTGVDDVFYCPHHPEGTVEEYRRNCNCRKPGTGMFEMACKKFDIDMINSYMVGDRAGDIIAGRNAGIKTILLESGYGTKNLESAVSADYVFADLRNLPEIL